MTAKQFTANPNCLAYEQHLLRLQELTLAGRDESTEADVIRDQMDAPWVGLSQEERNWVGGLSADLYMLSDEEIIEKADPAERGPETLGVMLLEARHQGDWVRVLNLLRKGPAFLPKPTIAFLRGLGYLRLGHPKVALLFFDHASTLTPHDDDCAVFSLQVLRQLGRNDELLARAKRYSTDTEVGLSLSVHSVSEVFRSTRSVSEEEAKPVYEQLISVLSQKLQRNGRTGSEDPETVAFGYLLLGACFESVGLYQQALGAYDKSVAIDPLAQHAYVAKGALAEKMRDGNQASRASVDEPSDASHRHRENRFRIVLNAEPRPEAA